MISINDLPTELVLQIFNCKVLTPGDISRCAKVCRRFRDVAHSSDYKVDYEFKVDHPSRHAWLLIRCILLDRTLGERIRDLRITWHRRRRQDQSTWTLKWHWTEAELLQISEICEKWCLPKLLYPAIEIGLNSEALLPLLLCLTPKLESLDVGDVTQDMISDDYGHTVYDAYRIYNHSVGLPYEVDVDQIKKKEGRIELKEWYASGGAVYCSDERGQSREPIIKLPWIYQSFSPIGNLWLPGLSNIKEFSHGGSTNGALRSRPEALNIWPNTNIPTMLMLPRLETLKLSHINALMGTPISGKKPARKPSLKRLEIFHYRFYRYDFEAVADMTGGALESVECILSDENFTPWDMSPEEKIKIITDYFQQNSPDTLARENISVTRSFKPFWDDFVFDNQQRMALLREAYQSRDVYLDELEVEYTEDDELELEYPEDDGEYRRRYFYLAEEYDEDYDEDYDDGYPEGNDIAQFVELP